jgi:hypothetical protein
MFSAPIPAPAVPRTRADERRTLVKRIALAFALFALVGWFCWRIYESTPVPTPLPRAGLSVTESGPVTSVASVSPRTLL